MGCSLAACWRAEAGATRHTSRSGSGVASLWMETICGQPGIVLDVVCAATMTIRPTARWSWPFQAALSGAGRRAPGLLATARNQDGNTALEAPVPVVDGFAFIITRQLTTGGTHPLTAMFTPTNPTALRPSTSNTVRVKVEGGDDNGDG